MEDEENLGRNIPSDCWTELTRINSDSSTLTADAFKDFWRLDANAPPVSSTAWTDEMHNAYIHSLEATFIDQLRHSISFCDSPLKMESKAYSSNESVGKCRGSSHQVTDKFGNFKFVNPTHVRGGTTHLFTVLQNGRWQRIEKRNGILPESTGDSHFVGEGPWIQSSPIAGRAQCLKDHSIQNQHALCSWGCVEVSDQNFLDEEAEERSSRHVAAAKRLKTAEVDASINDQVVPLGTSDKQDALNVNQERVRPGFLLGNAD